MSHSSVCYAVSLQAQSDISFYLCLQNYFCNFASPFSLPLCHSFLCSSTGSAATVWNRFTPSLPVLVIRMSESLQVSISLILNLSIFPQSPILLCNCSPVILLSVPNCAEVGTCSLFLLCHLDFHQKFKILMEYMNLLEYIME